MIEEMQPEVIRFLDRHKIPQSQLFDLDGRDLGSCYDEMVAEEKLFGYNATACSVLDSGHKLVTRAGHCMECEPAGAKAIAAIRRLHGLGDVYIAGSLSTSLLNVGSTTNADKRVPVLNELAYGGATDWKKLHVIRAIANSGKIEFAVHSKLERYRVRDVSYMKEGKEQLCYDLFSCSAELALEEFKASVPKGSKIASQLPSELSKYYFPDLATARR